MLVTTQHRTPSPHQCAACDCAHRARPDGEIVGLLRLRIIACHLACRFLATQSKSPMCLEQVRTRGQCWSRLRCYCTMCTWKSDHRGHCLAEETAAHTAHAELRPRECSCLLTWHVSTAPPSAMTTAAATTTGERSKQMHRATISDQSLVPAASCGGGRPRRRVPILGRALVPGRHYWFP